MLDYLAPKMLHDAGMRNQVFTAARDAVSPDNQRVFRMKSMELIRFGCSALLVSVLPIIAFSTVLRILLGISLTGSIRQLITLAFGLLAMVLASLIMTQVYPTRVGEKGIGATDFWGRKVILSWAEIENVEAKRFITLPYLLVKSFRKDRLVMWLPLFVHSPEKMREAIAHHASPNNPLRRYLEDEQEPEREPQRA